MRSAPAIAFDYRPSRALGVLGVVVGMLAMAAPWGSGLGIPARIVVSLAALALTAGSLRRHVQPRVRRISCREGEWFLLDARGDEHAARLRGSTRLGPLLALGFTTGWGSTWLVLAPDNLDADTRRRLILLLARTPATDEPPAMPPAGPAGKGASS